MRSKTIWPSCRWLSHPGCWQALGCKRKSTKGGRLQWTQVHVQEVRLASKELSNVLTVKSAGQLPELESGSFLKLSELCIYQVSRLVFRPQPQGCPELAWWFLLPTWGLGAPAHHIPAPASPTLAARAFRGLLTWGPTDSQPRPPGMSLRLGFSPVSHSQLDWSQPARWLSRVIRILVPAWVGWSALTLETMNMIL